MVDRFYSIKSNLSTEVVEDSKEEKEVVIIIDDLAPPSDYRFTPEEYERLYNEKHNINMPAPEEYEAAYYEEREQELISFRFLVPSLSTETVKAGYTEGVNIIEERLARDFDMPPEEYNKIRAEYEEERLSHVRYGERFGDPEVFYNPDNYEP